MLKPLFDESIAQVVGECQPSIEVLTRKRSPRTEIAGLGLTVAEYKQDVELQGSNEGTTDLGLSVRVGVRFLLMTRGATTSSAAAGNAKWSSFLFLEAQRISAEIDDIDLGGEAYTLGFRMEFDLE